MNILYIDTHLHETNIILFKDSEIINQSIIKKEMNNNSILVPTIKQIINNISIDEIIVINGPGSFTGIRAGITVAKTMAYLKHVPIKSVSYLDLMDYSLDEENNIVGLYDNCGIYVGKYKNHKLIGDYTYIKLADFKQYNEKEYVKTDVTIDYKKALKEISELNCIDPKLVNPIYVKKLDYDKKN